MKAKKIHSLPWGGYLIETETANISVIISHSNFNSFIVVCGLGSFTTSIKAPKDLEKIPKKELLTLAEKAVEEYNSFMKDLKISLDTTIKS